MKRPAALLLAVLALASCGSDRLNYQDQLREILDTSKSPFEMKERLLELDQGVPDKAVIKLNLGILCPTLGQVDEAGVYLGRAHELKRARSTGEERYLLLSGFGGILLQARTLRGGSGLRAASPADRRPRQAGRQSIIARVHYKRRELDKAYESFRQAWTDNREKLMKKEDHDVFFVLLLKAKEWTEAYQVVQAYVEKFGYEYGLGVKTSALLEKTGRINSSILAPVHRFAVRPVPGDDQPGDGQEEPGGAWPPASILRVAYHQNRGERVFSAGLRTRPATATWGEAGKIFRGDRPLHRSKLILGAARGSRWFGWQNGDAEPRSSAAADSNEGTPFGISRKTTTGGEGAEAPADRLLAVEGEACVGKRGFSARGPRTAWNPGGSWAGPWASPRRTANWCSAAQLKELAERYRGTRELQYTRARCCKPSRIGNDDYTTLTEEALRALA